ncbi:DUF427 domain-containing protein [Streptomyces sp. BF23-18]|uniref:DUF427 domain-containing protein n=1 Tax=Streptomyces sp. BF23-18 TaxID=3240282 RepID=UPI0034E4AED5
MRSRNACRSDVSPPPCRYRSDLLFPSNGHSWCEWKGTACCWDLISGYEVHGRAAWSYSDPDPAYTALRDYFAFYTNRVDRCLVGSEEARAQEGAFYVPLPWSPPKATDQSACTASLDSPPPMRPQSLAHLQAARNHSARPLLQRAPQVALSTRLLPSRKRGRNAR